MANVDAAHHEADVPTDDRAVTAGPFNIHPDLDAAPGVTGRVGGVVDVADDEKTKWAIDVMTAWTQHDHHDGAFLHDRIEAYVADSREGDGLVVGLINLSGLLLSGMEMTTGRNARQILQAIASTIARHEVPPPH